MCTYQTERVALSGSGKGPAGWFSVSLASVYFDHPVHAPAEHTLNIDFLGPELGPGARVAVELTAESARALGEAILAAAGQPVPGGHAAQARRPAAGESVGSPDDRSSPDER